MRCVMENGHPVLINEEILEGAKQQPELLLELLRSDTSLSKDVRNYIADLLDSNTETPYWFGSFHRRKRGRHAAFNKWHMDAALYVEEHLIEVGQYDAIIKEAATVFEVGTTQVKEAYSILKKVRKEEIETRLLESNPLNYDI